MPEPDIFQSIQRAAMANDLDFLLIGGHAVNAYGYQRTTIDLDLLARESQRATWKEMLRTRGYTLIHETPAFAQFDPPNVGEFNLDLMFVDETTFGKLAAEKHFLPVGDAVLPVPGVLHLIALKLHAARTAERAASGKDYHDVLNLIRAHRIDVASAPFQEILTRYAPEQIRRRLLEEVSGRSGN